MVLIQIWCILTFLHLNINGAVSFRHSMCLVHSLHLIHHHYSLCFAASTAPSQPYVILVIHVNWSCLPCVCVCVCVGGITAWVTCFALMSTSPPSTSITCKTTHLLPIESVLTTNQKVPKKSNKMSPKLAAWTQLKR